MCRNIRNLYNFKPPATEEEIRASSLQFVRKLSGFNRPSKANEEALRPRGGGGGPTPRRELIDSLVTTAPPRDREAEAEKARGPLGRAIRPARPVAPPSARLVSRGDQARSKRSRSITLVHAATKSCTNFSFEVRAGIDFHQRAQLRMRTKDQVDAGAGPLDLVRLAVASPRTRRRRRRSVASACPMSSRFDEESRC